MKTKLLFILGIALLPKLYATHLIGSQITYEYLRTLPDSSREYRFTINISRDCLNGAAALRDDLDAGLYNAGTRKLSKTMHFTLAEKHINDCYTMCVEEGNYTCVISLAPDSSYYVTLEYCCRTNLLNVRNGQNGDPDVGVTIYCLVPSMVNSSPLFSADKILSSPPAVTDTFRFYTQDTDGDSVAVTLTAPHVGASLTNNYPPPSDTFSGFVPISPSQYATGYNAANPLGVSSIMICDPTSKIIVVKGSHEGVYAVAYKVSEFRKGVLIAEYVRESLVYITNYPKPAQKITLKGSYQAPNFYAHLTWNAPCSSRIKKQYLERSADDQLHYKVIDSIANTSGASNDMALVKGHTYFYRVRTAGTDGSQYYSNVWSFNYFDAGLYKVSNNIVSVYPIPVEDQCTISTEESEIIQYNITDVTGRQFIVPGITDSGKEVTLDCSSLKSGVYIIYIRTASGEQFYKRISKI